MTGGLPVPKGYRHLKPYEIRKTIVTLHDDDTYTVGETKIIDTRKWYKKLLDKLQKEK